MDEYVSREAVRDMLHNEISSWGGYSEEIEALLNANEKLFELPVADVVEVKHSKWKHYHKQNIAVCMNCSFERDLDADFGTAISCPNCGAKMDGGADNGTE